MAAQDFRSRFNGLTKRILMRVGDRATLEDGSEVLGTFENPHRDTRLGSKGLGAASDASALGDPRFSVLAEDAARLAKGTVLTIELPPAEGGGRYRVARPEPEGDGMVALVLEVDRERTANIR